MAWPTKDDFVDGDVLTAAQVNNIADNLNLFDPTSATNGQVWVANGSGSGAYASAGGGLTQIAQATPTSGTTVTFSSIPATYKSLLVVATGLTVNGSSMTHYGLTYNTSTSTNVVGRFDYTAAVAGVSQTATMEGNYGITPCNPVSGNNYNVLSSNANNTFIWQVWDYANSTSQNKLTTMWSTYISRVGTYPVSGVGSGVHQAVGTINQLVIRVANGTAASAQTFTAGTITLYGVN